jgi:hypothetical protein
VHLPEKWADACADGRGLRYGKQVKRLTIGAGGETIGGGVELGLAVQEVVRASAQTEIDLRGAETWDQPVASRLVVAVQYLNIPPRYHRILVGGHPCISVGRKVSMISMRPAAKLPLDAVPVGQGAELAGSERPARGRFHAQRIGPLACAEPRRFARRTDH